MDQSDKYFWNIDRIMTLILGVAISICILWLIYYLRDALLPFFVACVIAYMLQPIVELNRKIFRLKGRGFASILTIVEVVLIISLIAWLTLPIIIKELNELGSIIHDVSKGHRPLPPFYASCINFIDKYLDPSYISKWLASMNINDLLSKGGSILEQSAEVIIHTVAWLLTLIYVLFILIDYPQIVRGFKKIIPQKHREQALTIVNDIKNSMNHYFRGQGIVALCAAVLYCIGFYIVGLPLSLPMGVLVGILYMIPYFQYITLIPVAAICLVYSLGGEVHFLAELGKCALVYIVSQSICDYIITPHIMGKELGLNPAIILLSLSVWGSLLGIIGMIIALPITALIMAYYEKYISNRS